MKTHGLHPPHRLGIRLVDSAGTLFYKNRPVADLPVGLAKPTASPIDPNASR